MSLCLLMYLTGCGAVKTEYIYQCDIPPSLIQPNPEPYIKQRITWGECPLLYTELLNELRQCNADKRAIKQITNE